MSSGWRVVPFANFLLVEPVSWYGQGNVRTSVYVPRQLAEQLVAGGDPHVPLLDRETLKRVLAEWMEAEA